MSDTPMFNGVDLSTLSAAELIDIVTQTNAKLSALEAAKPKREAAPREKTAEQLAKEAARAAFEAVTLDDEGTLVRLIQDSDRFNQVDAASKLIRALPYDRVARVVADLATEVAAIDGSDPFAVATASLVRKARAKKTEAAVDPDVAAAADTESDAPAAE